MNFYCREEELRALSKAIYQYKTPDSENYPVYPTIENAYIYGITGGIPVQEPNKRINEYLIGSCKSKNQKIGIDEYELLTKYAQTFGKGDTYHYYIFSLGGFTDELIELSQSTSLHLLTLDDIYK